MRTCSVVISILFLALMVGCGGAPKLPELPGREPRPIERLALDGKITPKDIREIFKAVNHDGRLNSIRNVVEAASDSELEDLSKILTRYIYQESDFSDGALNLIQRRVDKRDFSRLSATVDRWSKEADFPAQRRALQRMVAWNRAPELISRDISFIEPETSRVLLEARAQSEKHYRPKHQYPEAPVITAREVVSDAQQVLDNPKLSDRVVADLGSLSTYYFGTTLLETLRESRAQRESAEFEGLGYGLAAMLKGPVNGREPYLNQLDLLLHFGATANQSTQGMFKVVQTSLRDKPEQLALVGAKLQSLTDTSIAEVVRERLAQSKRTGDTWLAVSSKGPSVEFTALLKDIQATLEDFVGTRSKHEVFLNSFALAKWFEEVVSQNRKLLESKREPKETFNARFWDIAVRVKPFTIDFVDEAGALVGDWEKLLPDEKFKEWWGRYKKLVAVENRKDRYRFGSDAEAKTFSDQLIEAFRECGSVNRMIDGEATFKALARQLTHPAPGSLFTLEEMETPNIFDSFNRLLIAAPLPQYRRIARSLFDNILEQDDGQNIGRVQADVRDRILDVFSDEGNRKIRDMMEQLLNSIGMVRQLDKPVHADLPSPFEFYKRLVEHSSSRRVPFISRILALAGDGRFFGQSETKDPLFPSAFKFVGGGDGVTKFLNLLSWIPESEETRLLVAAQSALGSAAGLGLHREALKYVVDDPAAAEGLVAKMQREGWDLLPSLEDFPAAERAWVARFVKNSDHVLLWNFFSKHMTRSQLRSFVGELQILLKRGDLAHAFGVLSFIQDERIKKVAAVCKDAAAQGELAPLFSVLEKLLEN